MSVGERGTWATANGRLYELLQVDPSVPADEIHKTFHTLTLRKQYKSAFDVLSNPDKKRVYDIGGEHAVEHLESKTWGTLIAVLGSTFSLVVYGIVWICIAVLASLFFIFLPLRVDEGMVSWTTVFIPLYILFIGAVVGSILVLTISCVAPRVKGDNLFTFRAPIVRIVVAIGYFIFMFLTSRAVMDAAANDDKGSSVISLFPIYNTTAPENGGDGNVTWMYYFIILIIVDVISVVEGWSWKYPRRIARLLEPTGSKKPMTEQDMSSVNQRPDYPPFSLTWGFTFIAILDFILAVVRNVFLGLKLDGKLEWSWYIIFIPIAVRLFSSVMYRLHVNRIMNYLGQKTPCQVFLAVMGSLIVNGALIISAYMIAFRLESKDLRLVFALIPTYFVLFYFLVAAIFTAIYFSVANRQVLRLEATEERRNKEAQPDYQPDGETTTTLTTDPAAKYRYNDYGNDDEEEEMDDNGSEPFVGFGHDPFDSSRPSNNNNRRSGGRPVSSVGSSVVSEETVVDKPSSEEDSYGYGRRDDDDDDDDNYRGPY